MGGSCVAASIPDDRPRVLAAAAGLAVSVRLQLSEQFVIARGIFIKLTFIFFHVGQKWNGMFWIHSLFLQIILKTCRAP